MTSIFLFKDIIAVGAVFDTTIGGTFSGGVRGLLLPPPQAIKVKVKQEMTKIDRMFNVISLFFNS